MFHERVGTSLIADERSLTDQGYYNHSVYFDSFGHLAYSAKREGQSLRTKPRLRSYRAAPDGEPDSFFLEFKNRDGDVVWKDRAPVGADVAQDLLDGRFFRGGLGKFSDNAVLGRFEYLSRRYGLRPCVTVVYRRQAFRCPWYPRLRITYDSSIRTAFAAPGKTAPARCYVVPPNQHIVEIKYDRAFPSWLRPVIQEMALERVSISKYASALERLYRPGFKQPWAVVT